MLSSDSTRAMAVTLGNHTVGSSLVRWRVPAAIAKARTRCTGTGAIPNFKTFFMGKPLSKHDLLQHKNH
jgi:hypothetical protein